MVRRILVLLLALLSIFLLAGARRRAVRHPGSPPFELRLERSFAITDEAVLAPFRFERVLDAIADGGPGSGETLFRQWMDTQNAAPGLDAAMPHCDDERTNGIPTLNGFALRCPAVEGALATAPYVPDSFVPIGITNRFDMADAAGAHCGQYRLLFANGNLPATDAFHVIFEAALPNPRPHLGLAGCRPVAQFWADLSNVDALDQRRMLLERFFFEGLDGFAPAIDAAHFRIAPAGIRTLSINSDTGIGFRQFRVERRCNTSCREVVRADVLENIPSGTLFDANDTSERAARFRAAFLENVKTLATRDVNLYHMRIPAEFLVPDPDPGTPDNVAFLFRFVFKRSQATAAGKQFHDEIAAELARLGSTLTPDEIVLRAETQSCVGCHFSGTAVGEDVQFPAARLDFQHVTEKELDDGEGGAGTRFAISPAMRDVFIPHRMKILRDFLVSGKPPVHSN